MPDCRVQGEPQSFHWRLDRLGWSLCDAQGGFANPLNSGSTVCKDGIAW